ncbi:zinc finger protein, putative [Plasmodium ovale curtisi]|uniref:Zinc finger protein, putative n=1 Tax=Plasmodium ovale curtisi TaxID=864141 RepID=A0A1A8WKN5_PLAOA|nr:zinc finger protein, putative [Plasmodium ovale curtisi]
MLDKNVIKYLSCIIEENIENFDEDDLSTVLTFLSCTTNHKLYSENMNVLENNKHNQKKNKDSISDVTKGTDSTYSFNTYDYSVNCSLETTNVSSSFDKSRELFALKENNLNENKLGGDKLNMFDSNKEILGNMNENTDLNISKMDYPFGENTSNGSIGSSDNIKNVINKIENMALSTFIENNDKYTKVIKYLMNENNILKESIKKEQKHIMGEENNTAQIQKQIYKSNISRANAKDNEDNTTIIGGKSNNNSNSIFIEDGLKKYLYFDEPSGNTQFSSENKDVNSGVFNSEDFIKSDDNFTNIMKTIDDLLISQNVGSFSSVKNNCNSLEPKDIFLIKNSNNVNTSVECENIPCNLRLFDTEKNVYPNFSASNMIDSNKGLIRAVNEKGEMVEKPFEENIENIINTCQEETEKIKEKTKESYYNGHIPYAQCKNTSRPIEITDGDFSYLNSSNSGSNNYCSISSNSQNYSSSYNYRNNPDYNNYYNYRNSPDYNSSPNYSNNNIRINEIDETPHWFKGFSQTEIQNNESRNVKQNKLHTKKMKNEEFGKNTNVEYWKDKLSNEEKDFYESLYKKTTTQFDKYVKSNTVLHNYAHIFDLLSRLRQAADHPYLILFGNTFLSDPSGKFIKKNSAIVPAISNDFVCGICLENVPRKNNVNTKCNHHFHKDCLKQYIESFELENKGTI